MRTFISSLLGAALLLGVGTPARASWQPAPGTTWQIQLTGVSMDLSLNVAVYDIDAETDITAIEALHARGVKVIAYIDAGSWESYRDDAGSYPREVLGRQLAGYPDERWVDIRRIDLLAPILEKRMDAAKAKGFDAIDFDNVDGHSNRSGFPLSAQDQLDFNRYLAGAAHARGMSVGLKNDLDQIADLVGDFDFAVNEQCFQYHEARLLKPFIAAGKGVFVIEYRTPLADFCTKAAKLRFSAIKKRQSLDAWRKACE